MKLVRPYAVCAASGDVGLDEGRCVSFIGPQDKLHQDVGRCDVFCLTWIYELQAMADILLMEKPGISARGPPPSILLQADRKRSLAAIGTQDLDTGGALCLHRIATRRHPFQAIKRDLGVHSCWNNATLLDFTQVSAYSPTSTAFGDLFTGYDFESGN
ncbi:unnamed protein product [Taenia asiatica]|uniref:Uncharacterized protein n=1 Tax=Taenia asiatica TaxID=60517 RepID=A0A0R3VY59_TAEAS|nr:unnamed protein product [Taenia asiatica]